jgi:parallel beta-helix repeat protein
MALYHKKTILLARPKMFKIRNFNICFTILVYLVISLSLTAVADTHYVSSGDSIQNAIDAAGNDDEIEVAAGTYLEVINFNGKAVRLYSSGGPEVTIIDASGLDLTVVTCENGEGANTILEGFTITGGDADRGGGMLNDQNSSPTVTNCIFTSNTGTYGGGMYNAYGSNSTVINCIFTSNTGTYGGGMNNNQSGPTVTNCTFSDNTAQEYAGGIYNTLSNPSVTDCTFTSNTGKWGGGMRNDNSSPTVTNCTFSNNSTITNGGGMFNNQSDPTVTNCTFTSNTANHGGGMINLQSDPTVINCTFTANTATYGGGMRNDNSSPTLTNCILWGNTPDEILVVESTPTITYSDIGGGWTGMGNIDINPMFADTDGRLLASSLCIDAGDDSVVTALTDLDGNSRIQGLCVDMGAFETTTPATPDAMITRLAMFIMYEADEGNIDNKLEDILLAKVDASISALDKDKTKIAINRLKNLNKQVETQKDKKITPEVAAVVVERTNMIIAALGV